MNNNNLSKLYNIVKLNITMRLKSNVVIAILVVFLFFGGGIIAQAQGVYGAGTDDKKVENATSAGTSTSTQSQSEDPGMFKGNLNGGSEGPTDPGYKDNRSPIGEGILFLSLLSGAYAFVRRNMRAKNED